jgi:hypothetical protein
MYDVGAARFPGKVLRLDQDQPRNRPEHMRLVPLGLARQKEDALARTIRGAPVRKLDLQRALQHPAAGCQRPARRSLQVRLRQPGRFHDVPEEPDLQGPVAMNGDREANDAARFAVHVVATMDA